MPTLDQLTDRLLDNRTLWPWHWRALLREAEPQLIERLVERLARTADASARHGYATNLVRLAEEPRFVEAFACEPVAAELVRQFAQEEFDETVPAFTARLLQRLVLRCGEAAHPALREVLAGPARPAMPIYEQDLPASLGVKLVALTLLGPLLGPAEVPVLAAVAGNRREPLLVRDQAALAWYRLAGETAAAGVAQVVVEGPLAYDWALQELPRLPQFARLGEGLVAPLAKYLTGESDDKRLTAARTLVLLGPPAVPVLEELVRTLPAGKPRQAAERALGELAPQTLQRLLQACEAAARGLSTADAPSVSPDRGLSRGG